MRPLSFRPELQLRYNQVSMSIADNIALVRERMQHAAVSAGRDAGEVRLMAVCKTKPVADIREAFSSGLALFGENRVQEMAAKAPSLGDLSGAKFHMIGHLQSNKARLAAQLFSAIDSLDSRKLGDRLNAAAAEFHKNLDILIEINTGGEAAKSGVAPASAELEEILAAAPDWTSLRIRGLMTVPPYTEDPEGSRPYFRQLRELRDSIAARRLDAISMDQLSMGMSHDFQIAIEEGSTCVRVGTAIFGERPRYL